MVPRATQQKGRRIHQQRRARQPLTWARVSLRFQVSSFSSSGTVLLSPGFKFGGLTPENAAHLECQRQRKATILFSMSYGYIEACHVGR